MKITIALCGVAWALGGAAIYVQHGLGQGLGFLAATSGFAAVARVLFVITREPSA